MAEKIANLLHRYAHVVPRGYRERNALQALLEQELQVRVPLTHIVFEQHVLFVRAPSVIRSHVLLHKSALLSRLREQLGQHAPKDIR